MSSADKLCTTASSVINYTGGNVCSLASAGLWYKASIVAPVDVVITTVAVTKATTGAMTLASSIAATATLYATVY